MYSAWSTSWIGGIAVAIATFAGMALDLSTTSTPDPLSVSFIVLASLVLAFVVGGVMTMAVRIGLHLASCRYLALRFVLMIPVASLPILGTLATWPVETHALKLDMPTAQSSSIGFPLGFWLGIVGAFLIPVLVSYVAGLLARGAQVPPNKSLERTREG
jgi:hypothetical protein